MTTRFETKQHQLEMAKERHRREKQDMQELFNTLEAALYKKAYPRRKLIRHKISQHKPCQELFQVFKGKAYELGKRQQDEVQDLERQLCEIAQKEPVPLAEEYTKFRHVSTWTFSTQGWGAQKYAKGEATVSALEIATTLRREHGDKIDAKYLPLTLVVPVLGTGDHGGKVQGYDVLVKTTKAGVKLLKKKPGFDLKEWVRQCWANGINPRVINPFLPHGFEAKHGLGFFGGYLKGVKR